MQLLYHLHILLLDLHRVYLATFFLLAGVVEPVVKHV